MGIVFNKAQFPVVEVSVHSCVVAVVVVVVVVVVGVVIMTGSIGRIDNIGSIGSGAAANGVSDGFPNGMGMGLVSEFIIFYFY